ncbi:hypothetical protein [Methylocystis bryophila]|uniref:Uncharacterized protein n=1 Tax=Methylocystis bryophila TaxID=655015 RepID=A0A1W6MVR4_9HYPH|nr:hypothetical protein [Methylocystis bryophila]ARN81693.1 hypothetical protein B1812_12095 [Methylocystis bryophila]BDV37742.1 hypothetical protein DSM21852_09950 [Methylocystis bryophila]
MSLDVALVISFVVWLLFILPDLRSLAAMISIVVAIGVAVMLIIDKRSSHAWVELQETERQAERQKETARAAAVNLNAIELRHETITKSSYGYSNGDQGFTFKANVKNNAATPISALVIAFTAYDCPTATVPVVECEAIGHNSSQIEIDVPPAEVRAVMFSFQMKNFPSTRGVLTWRTQVASMRR